MVLIKLNTRHRLWKRIYGQRLHCHCDQSQNNVFINPFLTLKLKGVINIIHISVISIDSEAFTDYIDEGVGNRFWSADRGFRRVHCNDFVKFVGAIFNDIITITITIIITVISTNNTTNTTTTTTATATTIITIWLNSRILFQVIWWWQSTWRALGKRHKKFVTLKVGWRRFRKQITFYERGKIDI